MDFSPLNLPHAQWQALQAAHVTPPRAYHHFGHVKALLQHCQQVAMGPGWAHPREVYLAALYHDAVYVAGRKDNEARSAQLALQAIEQWLPGQGVDAQRVQQLILDTARHGQIGVDDVDAETALFLDCDMAILGAPAEVFDAYDRGVAEEYRGVVPGFLYRAGRRRFLQGLLKQPRIFLSDFFHQQLDGAARENLRRTLQR